MEFIEPFHVILDDIDGEKVLSKIEFCGRVCYKSEDRMTLGSAQKFVRGIIKSGHESVLEHFSFSVRFVVSRAIANEIVRHRALSFSQQSTRYCNYSGEIHFVRPWWMHDDDSNFPEEKRMFEAATEDAEFFYNRIVEKGNKPQFARAWLPNCLATELCATGTVRMWRDFLKLRNTSAAHPDMQIIAEKIDVLMRSLNAQKV